MSEAILKYNLSDPDDRRDFKRAASAWDLVLALTDVDEYLRAKEKYCYDEWEKLTGVQALERIREEFYNALRFRNIDLDEL